MLSKTRKWKFRIQHIFNAIAENCSFVKDMTYEDFCRDPKTLKAVVWNLTIIGEAARHVPPSIEVAKCERQRVVRGSVRLDF